MPLAIIELLTPVSEVMPSMFSTHTNEVEIIIGLLMTCWKMGPLRGLCLHFPHPLWALNLSAVSCATNWASLCFWLDRPATACSLQAFPHLMFSEAAVTGLTPKHPQNSRFSCTLFVLYIQVWLRTTSSSCHAGSCSQPVLQLASPRKRKCRFVGGQEALLSQMTGSPTGKVSSNPEFYFSAFPLHAYIHFVWAAMRIDKADLFFKCPSLEPLFFKTKKCPKTQKPLNYLSEIWE